MCSSDLGIADGGCKGAVNDMHKHGIGEEGDIIVVEVCVFGEEIWAVGEGVRGDELFYGDMDEFKVKVC